MARGGEEESNEETRALVGTSRHRNHFASRVPAQDQRLQRPLSTLGLDVACTTPTVTQKSSHANHRTVTTSEEPVPTRPPALFAENARGQQSRRLALN
jgi:hypothetical protein